MASWDDVNSISCCVKKNARVALKPYLEGNNYSDCVKNPIALLNYLYQHKIIPEPVYKTKTETDAENFLMICHVGEHKTIGSGRCLKEAKKNSAQLFLDVLLNNDEDVLEGDDVSSRANANANAELRLPVQIQNTSENSNMPNTNHIQFLYENENNLKRKYDNNHFNQFAGAFFSSVVGKLKDVHADATFSLNNGPDVAPSIWPARNIEVDDICRKESKKKRKRKKKKQKTVHTEHPADCFSSENPAPNISAAEGTADILRNNGMEVECASQPTASSTEELNESNKTQVKENTLQIMYEKAYKLFKMIPRIDYENNASGFRCKLRVNTFTGIGEGRSKKEARLNAAVNLLDLFNTNT